tara:strand:+ start:922 stop:1614 length:693 start_codon:yes stop_codon:yes gene_type:complete
MNIVIIPARSGSKRIKNKNIKNFLGFPIIKYPLKTIIKSKIIDMITVSTNSKKIGKISKKYGADLILSRNKKLSNDYSTTHQVVKDAIIKLEKLNYKIDNVFCIYPCNPFLNINDLKKAISILKKNNKIKYIFPGVRYSHPIERAFSLQKNFAKFLKKKKTSMRTQDCKPYYHDAGQFYLGSRDSWMKNEDIHNSSYVIEIPSFRALDIDSIDDWKKAEILYKSNKNQLI